MKKFDRIKTIQLILLIAITASSLVVILRNSELYALIATNMAAKTISILLWLTLLLARMGEEGGSSFCSMTSVHTRT